MSSAARKTLTTTGLATAAVLLPGAMSKNPKPFNYKGPISTAPASIVESKMPTIGMPSVPKKPDPMVKIGRKLYNPDVADQMGLSGHEYVRKNYGWDTVMEGVEEALLLAQSQFAMRRHALKR